MATTGTVRTVGIEEELLLIDPESRSISARSRAALKANRDRGRARDEAGRGSDRASDDLDQELFRHQVETRTDPVADLADAHEQLCAARRTAGEAARAAGVVAVAAGIAPYGDVDPRVSPDARYRAMLDQFGEVARTGGTCGMHVHVGIDSPEQGVGVIDRIAPWLPVLLAVSANSPYVGGRDSGHASWRSQVWARWPSAGPTEAFGSLEGYRRVAHDLVATGAARDEGMLYFDARLAREQPTVEVRVFDVCTDPQDAVLLAALVRGLVSWAAEAHAEGSAVARPRAEVLRAAQWRAARYALTDRLVDPHSPAVRPAADVLAELVDLVRPWLEAAGDLERVDAGVSRVLRAGGATRQRAAFERARQVADPQAPVAEAVRAVVDDLVARSEAVWDPRPVSESARSGEGVLHG